jgi:hypothetical protein
MTESVRLIHWGMEGVGRNRAEAKENAMREVRRRLEGPYTPWFFQADQHLLLVRRDPEYGWIYETLSEYSCMSGRFQNSYPGAVSFADTRRIAANHFAKLLTEATGTVPEALREFMGAEEPRPKLPAAELPPLPVERFETANGLQQVLFDFCPIVGEGPDQGAARRDADRKITALFNRFDEAWYLRDRGFILLLWRHFYLGWSALLLRPRETRSDFLSAISTDDDFVWVRRCAVSNYAREAYTETQLIHPAVQMIMGPIAVAAHAKYTEAYRAAVGQGVNETDARLAADIASGVPHLRMAS